MRGDNHGRNEAHKSAQDPHKSACHDLVGKRADAEECRSLSIAGIEDAITKGEKRSKNAAGKHPQEKIEGDGPTGPARFGWERLNDGPPEQKRGEKEAGVFHLVPEIGAQREFKSRRNVPGKKRDGGKQPAS